MAQTPSTMLPLGTAMHSFALPDFSGVAYSSDDYKGKPILVMVICNHCPFVKHIVKKLSDVTKDYQAKGVSVVAISANDVVNFPDDSPAKMAEFSRENDFTFPYLYDETQTTAKEFHAACTPDFFLFDSSHLLVYRGQFDDSRPGNGVPVTGENLNRAVEDLAAGRVISKEQKSSLGCNIKWKTGNEPEYF